MDNPLRQEQDHHVVLLAQTLDRDEALRQTLARLTDIGVTLIRFQEQCKAKSFTLSDEAMDELCASWQAFREAQEQARMVEERRKDEMREKAFAIAREYPEIKIENLSQYEGTPWWRVSLTASWKYFHNDAGANPLSLLEQVETCKKACMTYLETEAEERIREEVMQACSLAQQAGIAIEQGLGGYNLYRENVPLRCDIEPEDLLKAVREETEKATA